MKAPDFWFTSPDRPGIRARLLSPLGHLFGAATARRVARTGGYRPQVPVICIGNLNAGGTGKTPTAIAVAQRLLEKGVAPHVVSRGYRGRHTGSVRVDERNHSAADVGDEPLLLAAFLPTWVGKDRAKTVEAAEDAGAEVILLDDGFQNPTVRKDLSIVVVDAQRGFGNARCLPAGPLREPAGKGLARADFVLTVGDADAQDRFDKVWGAMIPGQLPHLRGRLTPLETGLPWRGLKVLAFAGIGHPEKFFQTLKKLGCDLVRAEALGDHQPLGDALLKRLETEARLRGAQLVTTEKDAVRLPTSFKQKVLTVPVRLEIDDWTLFDQALAGL